MRGELKEPRSMPERASEPEMFRRAVGIAIARRRYALGLTQAQLADRVEAERPVVARVEVGKHEILIRTLRTYARALDTRASVLLDEAERLVEKARLAAL